MPSSLPARHLSEALRCGAPTARPLHLLVRAAASTRALPFCQRNKNSSNYHQPVSTASPNFLAISSSNTRNESSSTCLSVSDAQSRLPITVTIRVGIAAAPKVKRKLTDNQKVVVTFSCNRNIVQTSPNKSLCNFGPIKCRLRQHKRHSIKSGKTFQTRRKVDIVADAGVSVSFFCESTKQNTPGLDTYFMCFMLPTVPARTVPEFNPIRMKNLGKNFFKQNKEKNIGRTSGAPLLFQSALRK
jgi:hypothetical protein